MNALLILGLISLILVIFWGPPFEHMTNSDVQKKHDFHQSNPTKWDINEKKENEIKEKIDKGLKGPRITPLDPNEPLPINHNDTNSKNSAIYPQIYGPESLKTPGHKDTNNTNNTSIFDDTQYTGFQEFPSGPSEPQPFLSDFSKMLK
jgi:hypothetical protein